MVGVNTPICKKHFLQLSESRIIIGTPVRNGRRGPWSANEILSSMSVQFFYSWWRQPERKICGRFILSLTVLCLFLQKNGKLQFAASSTRSNLMPDFKHGNTLLVSLFILSSKTVFLQFLATWTLAFFMYYSDFIPYEYEQGLGKNLLSIS